MQRQARQRERLVTYLARMRVLVNHAEPTVVCLILMKVLDTHSRDAEKRCRKWLGPGWFSIPKGFNAGRLKQERVPVVIDRLRPYGPVWEVTFTKPPLTGLKLFYLEKVDPGWLGPGARTCTFTRHPPAGRSR